MLSVSVILPTHNPDASRLRRALQALRAQSLAAAEWELVVVDNRSAPALSATALREHGPSDLRVVREETLGLTSARRSGFNATRAPLVVMVDDDNVLVPDYLAEIVRLFAAHPILGAAGGPSLPEFESALPAWWSSELEDLLACRDLGPREIIAPAWSEPPAREYPLCSPIGAGMALRRAAFTPWLSAYDESLPDRRGGDLSSGGDNDLVMTALSHGWSVGYFPTLRLTHLIPAARLDPAYLARLKRGIARSWIRVLAKHRACPWPPISPASVPLRKLKAWFAHRAWSGPVGRIRWQGACGHFEGLAEITG